MSFLESFEDYNSRILNGYPLLIEDLLNLSNEYIKFASTLSEIQRVELENRIALGRLKLALLAPEEIFDKIPPIRFTNNIDDNILKVQNQINILQEPDIKEPVEE
jgi:hypothetical protein